MFDKPLEFIFSKQWNNDQDEDALKALVTISMVNTEIKENVQTIFQFFFGARTKIALAIVRAGLVIEKRERELREERELAKKEREVGKKKADSQEKSGKITFSK